MKNPIRDFVDFALGNDRALEPYEFQELADYNGRVHKGIVHTPEYVERMRAEQARFDRLTLERAKASGGLLVDQPPPNEPTEP